MYIERDIKFVKLCNQWMQSNFKEKTNLFRNGPDGFSVVYIDRKANEFYFRMEDANVVSYLNVMKNSFLYENTYQCQFNNLFYFNMNHGLYNVTKINCDNSCIQSIMQHDEITDDLMFQYSLIFDKNYLDEVILHWDLLKELQKTLKIIEVINA